MCHTSGSSSLLSAKGGKKKISGTHWMLKEEVAHLNFNCQGYPSDHLKSCYSYNVSICIMYFPFPQQATNPRAKFSGMIRFIICNDQKCCLSPEQLLTLMAESVRVVLKSKKYTSGSIILIYGKHTIHFRKSPSPHLDGGPDALFNPFPFFAGTCAKQFHLICFDLSGNLVFIGSKKVNRRLKRMLTFNTNNQPPTPPKTLLELHSQKSNGKEFARFLPLNEPSAWLTGPETACDLWSPVSHQEAPSPSAAGCHAGAHTFPDRWPNFKHTLLHRFLPSLWTFQCFETASLPRNYPSTYHCGRSSPVSRVSWTRWADNMKNM